MPEAGEPSQAAAESIVAKYFAEVTSEPPPAAPSPPPPPQGEPAPEPAARDKPDTSPAPSAPSAPKAESLADVIRRAREERGEHARRDREHASLTEEVKRLRGELEAAKSGHGDPASDPVGWARALKMDKETQALIGQALLYDLVPEKAPPDMRVKLLEARIAREKADEARRAEEAEKTRKAEYESAQLNSYAATLIGAVTASPPGSYPESDAWFGDDRDTRTRSLVHTANNIAEAARHAGRMADLSPANVARVLEAEIAGRLKARDERRAAQTKTQTQTEQTRQAPETKVPAGSQITTSTKGLGGGTPRPPAQTDRERLERAIAAGFGPR